MSEKITINLKGHKCLRCGHEWVPRLKLEIPHTCPKCKSVRWNKKL